MQISIYVQFFKKHLSTQSNSYLRIVASPLSVKNYFEKNLTEKLFCIHNLTIIKIAQQPETFYRTNNIYFLKPLLKRKTGFVLLALRGTYNHTFTS